MPTQPPAHPHRANLHWGETGSWTDGDRFLNFDAGLGVSPAVVCIPTEAVWRRTAPAWARDRREEVIRDFEALGVRVVEMENATVRG